MNLGKKKRKEEKRMSNMEFIEVKEVILESDPERGNMVILKESPDAERYFLMFVGDAEFAAIAKEKGIIRPKRPLTHDLYLSILERSNVQFLRVEINDLKEDTFYANVVFKIGDEEHRVDSRPSDSVALALNRKIPIFVRKDLFRRKLSEEEIKDYEEIVKSVKF